MSPPDALSLSPSSDAFRSSAARSRVGSLIALLALALFLSYAAQSAYRIATDSFVAPITFSPESDVVLTSNLKLNELVAERARMVAERERIDAELAASERALTQLTALHGLADGALAWTSAVTQGQAQTGEDDLRVLRKRDRDVHEMQEKQDAFVAEMRKNLEAGLVSKSEYTRELQAASHLRLAAIDTQRARLATELQLRQARLARNALTNSGAGAAAPLMPEIIAQQNLSVHIELEILRLQAEQRASEAKKATAVEEIEKIDVLLSQLKARPIYRAIEARTNVAFVPYTQIRGVSAGAEVYQCLWGMFACHLAGKVSELLPGEVVMPDPWGSQARGQYAILDLSDAKAAMAKSLRVRSHGDVAKVSLP
jgi:hypothetical protein